jgi:RNA-directed DNA polymerase
MNPKSNQKVLQTPDPVLFMATQSGSSRSLKWGSLWLSQDSAHTWTERMLQALARGNDGHSWHTLNDKIFTPKVLTLAFNAVTKYKKAAGIDGITTQAYREKGADAVVPEILRLLQEDRYEPQPAKRVWIKKPGTRELRPLGIPTVRDRIVQQAIRIVIEPIFEQCFHPDSYGFRPGRKAQQAIEVAEQRLNEGLVWVVDADIKGYFDSISHERLMVEVRKKIADGKVLRLLEKFLRQGVMEQGKGWLPTEEGTPQGAIISPLLANIYLNALDHLMAERGWKMVRYADDFIIQCGSRDEAERALEQVKQWMTQAGLTLHPTKTKIVDATQHGGFDFLGWHFERGYKWPREKSQQKFKETIRGLTKRNNGHCLKSIIGKVNRVTRGWGRYFSGGVQNVGEKLTQWTRMRLRSILRKRDKRKGRGRGLDHHRYMDDWFAEQGLIFLHTITHPNSKRSHKAKEAAFIRQLRGVGKH